MPVPYVLLGRSQFAYDGIGAPAIRGEVDANGRGVSVLSCTTYEGRNTAKQEKEEY